MEKGKGRSKEGLSVVGLFQQYIQSKDGLKLLNTWCRMPTYDTSILRERQANT